MKKLGKAIGGLALLGSVIALVASFFLCGEDHDPGRFFIERQAYWSATGRYGVKFTFLLTLLTLLAALAVPLYFASAVLAFMTRPEEPSEPPPSWDTKQFGRRMKQLMLVVVLSAVWVAFTGAAVFDAAALEPLGFLASMLLLIIPLVPLAAPPLFFDALLPNRYSEGTIDALELVRNKNSVSVHMRVAGELMHPEPEEVRGLAPGMRVGVLLSGFISSVLKLEKR